MRDRQDGSPRRHTPARAVRVPDDLWQAAQRIAKERDETVTDVILRALNAYVRRHSKPDVSGDPK